jgi:hypothetical protein
MIVVMVMVMGHRVIIVVVVITIAPTVAQVVLLPVMRCSPSPPLLSVCATPQP